MLGALSTRTRSLRRLASAQDGSFLVEALVSAMILVIVGLGVLKSLDRGSRLGAEQKSRRWPETSATEPRLSARCPVPSSPTRAADVPHGRLDQVHSTRARRSTKPRGASCMTAG